MRINNYVDKFHERKIIHFMFEGKEVVGYQGDTIAAALIGNGVKRFSYSLKKKRPRGFFCTPANCDGSCLMIVNDIPRVRTCMTLLETGMIIKRQTDKGLPL